MKKRCPRLLALLIAVSTLLSLAVSAADPAEYDIPDDWSHDALVFAVENDVLRGDEKQNLNPQNKITRAEMAAVLVRLLGATQEGSLSAFTDVDPTAWYCAELGTAYACGIFGGVSETQMMPGAPITREQAVVVLCRAFGIVSDDREAYTEFSDAASVSAYARDSVSAMRTLGLLGGYEDGSFRPLAYITRAEIAQLLYNILDCIADAPDELPESGTVLYRGAEALPAELTLDGTLILGQAMPADFAPESWEITGTLVVRTASGTDADLTNVKASELVCAPLGGSVQGAADKVRLWGVSSQFTGGAKTLTVCGGTHSFTGDPDALDLRAGSLTCVGSAGDVAMSDGTTLRLDGSCGVIVMHAGSTLLLSGSGGDITVKGKNARLTIDGKVGNIDLTAPNATVDGSGRAKTISILQERCTVTLACDKLNDVWYETYQKEHDAALDTVETMRVACTVTRDTAIYRNQNLSGYIRSLPKGTTVYNEWHPAGDVFYVSLEDGTKGWVPRWDCYIPDDTVTTDGKLDYSKPTKEGFVDLMNYDSKTDYLVWVSRYTQKVIVFTGKQGDWELIKTFPCSTGANNTPTPEGIFEIYDYAWRWYFNLYYVNDVSIFNGGHAFHSILYGYNGSYYDETVGVPLSHGCVRMLPDDCRYIYDLPVGTRVIVY